MRGGEEDGCQGLQSLGVGVGLRLGLRHLIVPGPHDPCWFSEHNPCPEPTFGEKFITWSPSVAEQLNQALGARTIEETQT